MYMYLLMYSLLFSHTIMLLVVEVGCLQHPNVQTHAMKTFVVNNARYCTTSLLFLYDPIHLRAANALIASGHSFSYHTGTCSIFIIKANTATYIACSHSIIMDNTVCKMHIIYVPKTSQDS